MQNLARQEQFELEVLDLLNSRKILGDLVLGGGTMLRLCYGLNRFSVDLDFWIVKTIDVDKLFKDLKGSLAEFYTIVDYASKFYTIRFEIKSRDYPRCLKLEIRKVTKKVRTERMIAYSKYSTTQILLNVVSLEDMMAAKVEAFLDRKEIRDIFDVEFLLKKGIGLDVPDRVLARMLKGMGRLTKKDYTAKLGSLLEAEDRRYYSTENFKILESTIREKIGMAPNRGR
jgi:predicted nucleotidyltransferase component of viral defense system